MPPHCRSFALGVFLQGYTGTFFDRDKQKCYLGKWSRLKISLNGKIYGQGPTLNFASNI